MLFACVLALGTLLPTVDFCICAADFGYERAQSAVALTDQAPVSNNVDKSCLHGHCFHGVGIAQMMVHSFVTSERKLTAMVSPSSLPPAGLQTQLLRPPRA